MARWAWRLTCAPLLVVTLLSIGIAADAASEAAAARLFSCPPTTYPRSNPHGEHMHCVCPEPLICEGCEEGCEQLDLGMKSRCVRGFRPSCHSCRCSEGPEAAPAKLGLLLDRRREPFCPEKEPSPPYTKPYEYVFVISNGHTGTTFLGQQMNWRRVFGKLPQDLVIVAEAEADKGHLIQVPFESDFCELAQDYVVKEKIPFMERRLAEQNARVYFASGHQTLLGILPALVDRLKGRIRFIRLRRNRFDVAYSFHTKADGPCMHHCVYCPCPLDAATRCPVPGHLWGSLNAYQQYLWAVDEVECMWQALIRSRPDVPTLVLEWSKTISKEMMQRAAAFAGYPDLRPLVPDEQATNASNTHVNTERKNEKNMDELLAWDAQYRKTLQLGECNEFTCVPPLLS